MTDLEYDVLSFIRDHRPSVPWLDVLNSFLPSGRSLDADSILRLALQDGLVEKTSSLDTPPNCTIRISYLGIRCILEEQEHREKLALLRNENIQQEQQRKHENDRVLEAQAASQAEIQRSDRKFQVKLSLLQALLSFLAGAVTTNLDRIIAWVMSLFH